MGKYGTATVGCAIQDYTDGEAISGYSCVVIEVNDDTTYTAGDTSGRTLTLTNPNGTQQMANNILALVKNARYKPYDASGAIVDAAMELGDAINVHGESSRVYALTTNFGGILSANVRAPEVEELDEETPYKSTTERQIIRQRKQLRTEFKVVAGEISASITDLRQETLGDGKDSLKTQLSTKITQTAETIESSVESIRQETLGDGETSLKTQFEQTANSIKATTVTRSGGDYNTFGWSIYAPGEHDIYPDGLFEIAANLKRVFYVDPNGLYMDGNGTFTGTIKASAGEIGGFSIQKDYLSYKGKTWGDEIGNGAYIGAQGLAYGKTFSVTPLGVLTAKSGTIGGWEITANTIRGGAGVAGSDESSKAAIFGMPSGNHTVLAIGADTHSDYTTAPFRVTAQGDLYAQNGKFTGTVHADKISFGADGGYFNGAGISAGTISGGSSGQIASGTITSGNVYANTLGTGQFASGVNISLGQANYAHDALINGTEAVYIGESMFYLGGHLVYMVTRTIDGTSVKMLSWV